MWLIHSGRAGLSYPCRVGGSCCNPLLARPYLTKKLVAIGLFLGIRRSLKVIPARSRSIATRTQLPQMRGRRSHIKLGYESSRSDETLWARPRLAPSQPTLFRNAPSATDRPVGDTWQAGTPAPAKTDSPTRRQSPSTLTCGH